MFYTTEKQKELIKRIVDGYEDYEKLGDKLVLRMILDITNNAALEWNVKSRTTVLYNDGCNNMLDFIGCIGLIDFLLKNSLIYIHSQEDASRRKSIVATNAIPRDKARGRDIMPGSAKYFYKSKNDIEIPAINTSILATDICKKIESLSNSLVYPMPFLVDYVNHDFKTEEQLKFEKQMDDTHTKHKEAMRIADNTLKWTQKAFFVAFMSTLATFIVGILEIKDITIRELNNTIKEKNIPEVIETKLHNDTIKAIIVSQPENILNKPIKNQAH